MFELYEKYFNFLTQNVVTPFYETRLQKLRELSFLKTLSSKNPYLLKAKNLQTVEGIARSIIDSQIIASEESVFGGMLEKFAIYVSEIKDNGVKSSLASVDLEFERDEIYYLVEIKSGIVWGNRSQTDKLKENFKLHRAAFASQGKTVICVNGCMYGKDANPYKVDKLDSEKNYYKFAGQEFWEFLSGDSELYLKIIIPIGDEARRKDEIFQKAYEDKINEFVSEFVKYFMTDGKIDWNRLLEHTSRKPTPKALKSKKRVKLLPKKEKTIRESESLLSITSEDELFPNTQ